MWRWFIGSSHLVALALGGAGIALRWRGLAEADADLDGAVKRGLFGDNLWGVAALVWLPTGLLRAFGGLEKGTDYYLSSPAFWVKMGLFITILALEVWPMVTLIRWRLGTAPDAATAGRIARISAVQMGLTVLMVVAAGAMARGVVW
jgi:putative membrane protein